MQDLTTGACRQESRNAGAGGGAGILWNKIIYKMPKPQNLKHSKGPSGGAEEKQFSQNTNF